MSSLIGLSSLIFLLLVSSVSADAIVSIGVKDTFGKDISGKTVLIGTTAIVSGYYEDSIHGLEAMGNLTVWFRAARDSDFTLEATLFSGYIESPSTITRDYQLTKIGTYKFRWEVESAYEEATISTTTFVIPESPIGTLLGIIAPITSTFILFASKRLKKSLAL